MSSHRSDRKPPSLYKHSHAPSKSSSNWSEPILRRRSAVADSDSSSSSDARGETESTVPLDDLLPVPPAPASILKHTNCCCSNNRCNYPQRSHNHTRNKEKIKETIDRKILKENEMREQIEEKLCRNEVDDSILIDEQNNLQDRLYRANAVLEALGAYTNSLNLLDKAAINLHKATAGFMQKDLGVNNFPTSTTGNSLADLKTTDKIANVKNNISLSIIKMNELHDILESHKKKKYDFTLATNNFSQILHSSTRATVSQLLRLDQQYDTIQLKYQNSYMALNQELPKIIEEKIKILSKCLIELIPISEEIFEKETIMNDVLKGVSNALLERSKNGNCQNAVNKRSCVRSNCSQMNISDELTQPKTSKSNLR